MQFNTPHIQVFISKATCQSSPAQHLATFLQQERTKLLKHPVQLQGL